MVEGNSDRLNPPRRAGRRTDFDQAIVTANSKSRSRPGLMRSSAQQGEQTHSVSGRIVSVNQPHVRPIMRGNVSADIEFGAKISVSKINGFAFLYRLSPAAVP